MLDQFIPPTYSVRNGKVYRTEKVEKDTQHGPVEADSYRLVSQREIIVTGISRYPVAEFTVVVRKDTFTFESYTIPIAALASAEFTDLMYELEFVEPTHAADLLRWYFLDAINLLAREANSLT